MSVILHPRKGKNQKQAFNLSVDKGVMEPMCTDIRRCNHAKAYVLVPK